MKEQRIGRRAVFNEVEYHLIDEGNGDVALFLHGFPEFWYSWREQLAVLPASGFRVIAPDLRGYNLTAKPKGVRSYDSYEIAQDVVALIDSLGTRVHLVGHDWGGVCAWRVARLVPEKLRSLSILNVPHPKAILRSLRKPSQFIKLWYQWVFQPPALPEFVLRRRDYALLRDTMRRAAKRKDAMTDEVLERYAAAWREPGALEAMLNYYRAAYRRSPRVHARATEQRASLPTQMIWGDLDPVFSVETARSSAEFVPELEFRLVPGAGHFVQWDAPERVNELLLDFWKR